MAGLVRHLRGHLRVYSRGTRLRGGLLSVAHDAAHAHHRRRELENLRVARHDGQRHLARRGYGESVCVGERVPSLQLGGFENERFSGRDNGDRTLRKRAKRSAASARPSIWMSR